MPKATVTMSVTDVPEVRALIGAVQSLPLRWSDGCGECPWCRLDQAMADLGIPARLFDPSSRLAPNTEGTDDV